VPPGAWAAGVSGGADSVALLLLLRRRSDLDIKVVHLNHQARGAASDADADFVFRLSTGLGVDCIVGHWSAVEPMLVKVPKNRSARFRAGRVALFRHVVKRDQLKGVILAHHADDVAETVLQRILRGAGVTGLAAMRATSVVGGLTVLRPLLQVPSESLRAYLTAQRQSWREDQSNASPHYQRNRLRALLATRPRLTHHLLELGDGAAGVKRWLGDTCPGVDPQLPVAILQDLPPPLALESARRWLAARGAAKGELSRAVLQRLIGMATDAASPPRQHFPGSVLVRRRAGVLLVDGNGRE
jgi:tRNA(Ile)-lysidine synthase